MQVDFTLYEAGRQLKLPMETEIYTVHFSGHNTISCGRLTKADTHKIVCETLDPRAEEDEEIPHRHQPP